MYRAYNNNPPLKDFQIRDFSPVLIISKISGNFSALIILLFAGQIWALRRSIFKLFPRFCLKNIPKIFSLRRADGPGFYYSKKILANFSSALIIPKKSGIFSSVLIILSLAGWGVLLIPRYMY